MNMYGGVEVKHNTFLTLALDGGEWAASHYSHVINMYGGVEVKHHTFLTLALDGGEQSASHYSCFTSVKRAKIKLLLLSGIIPHLSSL
jgi:hypothetical protein